MTCWRELGTDKLLSLPEGNRPEARPACQLGISNPGRVEVMAFPEDQALPGLSGLLLTGAELSVAGGEVEKPLIRLPGVDGISDTLCALGHGNLTSAFDCRSARSAPRVTGKPGNQGVMHRRHRFGWIVLRGGAQKRRDVLHECRIGLLIVKVLLELGS